METLPQRQQRAMMPSELGPLRPAGAYTFDELFRFAQMCHSSGMFEDVADAAQAMVKIVRGQELGLPPTTAMTAIDIVHKRLFLKPWAIAAKINSCGYGRYEVLEQTNEVCTIRFTKKYPGGGWRDCPPVRYTLDEAKAHGLVNRSPHWKASPAHMLYQRCMGRGGAMYFPELLAGLEPAPDDTPIPPERHSSNVTDLFGDQEAVDRQLNAARQPAPLTPFDPEAVEASLAAARQGSATSPSQSAEAHGTRVYMIAHITALHQAHGYDLPWIAAYWRKMEARYEVTPGGLSDAQIAACEQGVADYYARQNEKDAQDAPGSTQVEGDVSADSQEGLDAATGQAEAFPAHPDTSAWRTLRAQYRNPAVPEDLREQACDLLWREDAVPESQAFGVASDVLDALEGRYTPPDPQEELL